MAPVPTESENPSDEPDRYVGLTADTAERRAYEHGWTTVRVLPPGAIITMEYLAGRLNLEVADKDRTVRRCWMG